MLDQINREREDVQWRLMYRKLRIKILFMYTGLVWQKISSPSLMAFEVHPREDLCGYELIFPVEVVDEVPV